MVDYFDSFDNVDEAVTTIQTQRVYQHSVVLTQLNLYQVIETFKKIYRESLLLKIVNLDLHELHKDRALWRTWDSNRDMLNFKLSNKVVPETKGGISSAVSLIFDPMSLIAPINVKIKLLIQELGKRGLNWDNKFPDNLLRQWNIWKKK